MPRTPRPVGNAVFLAALALPAGCDRDEPPPDPAATAQANDAVLAHAVDEGAGAALDSERARMNPAPATEPATDLHPALRASSEAAIAGFGAIPEDRRETLARLADFVRGKRAAGTPAHLTFICTHNSRRSHMAQLWAATAAAWYGVDGVGTWSGGTEATAFSPRAVAALERAGFAIESPGGENPRYAVTYAPEGPAMTCFSKVYDDPANPREGFAAVMTCTSADASCPFVEGAELRVSLPYDDPKAADGTPEETARYDERSRQIATEMFYLFSRI